MQYIIMASKVTLTLLIFNHETISVEKWPKLNK